MTQKVFYLLHSELPIDSVWRRGNQKSPVKGREHFGGIKWGVVILCCLLSTASMAFDLMQAELFAPETGGRWYDDKGHYQGRIEENGRMYDASGRYLGYRRENGRQYDSHGRYQGQQDADGRSKDEHGRFIGRINEEGKQYDAHGRYTGRVNKDGRVLDSSGRFLGRWK